MKLYKQVNRKWKGVDIPKFMINVPVELVKELGWKGGEELTPKIRHKDGKTQLVIEET